MRDLQCYLSPTSEHLLDWFHVTMRITVLRQQLKELVARAPTSDLDKQDEEFERIKWYLWHGNAFRALQEIEGVQWVLEDCEDEVPASTKLAKSLREFRGSIEAKVQFIPNYGERYRYGEAIATGFVESTVNQVVSKRMVKKQQMRFSEEGGASAAASAYAGAERRFTGKLRTLVSSNGQNRSSASGGGVAPGL